MPADKSSAPEFGPSGAVMNAPHMTGRMREKIARTDPRHPANWMPKPMKRLHLAVTLIAFAAMVPGLLLKDREPLIAMTLALAGSAIMAVNAVWYFIVLSHLRGSNRP